MDFNYGKKALDQVKWVAKGGSSSCGGLALAIAPDRQPSAALEQLATSRLWTPEPGIASDTAETIRESGSAESEKFLWKRLREWHERWMVHSENLDDAETKLQLQLGTALLRAIAQATGWIADADKLTELKEFCVSKDQCKEIDSYRDHWQHGPELELIVFNHDTVWPYLAQYELRSLD